MEFIEQDLYRLPPERNKFLLNGIDFSHLEHILETEYEEWK
jgi:hypothetical protein